MKRICQVELDVRASNRDGQCEPRCRAIRVSRPNVGPSRLQRLLVAAPEIDVVTEVECDTAVSHVASAIRRRQQLVARETLSGSLRVDRNTGFAGAVGLQHRGLRGMQPRLSNRQCRGARQRFFHQLVELWIAKRFPPRVHRPRLFLHSHRRKCLLRGQRFRRHRRRWMPVAIGDAAGKARAQHQARAHRAQPQCDASRCVSR